MQMAAEEYIQKMQRLLADNPARCPGAFKVGFHSIPSMLQLHLHVISQVCIIQLHAKISSCVLGLSETLVVSKHDTCALHCNVCCHSWLQQLCALHTFHNVLHEPDTQDSVGATRLYGAAC